MTVAAAALFVLGTSLELAALELARRDLRDAKAGAEQRTESKKSMMAAGKHVVDDWITQATRTRERGIYLFAGGLVLQTLANLLAL